MPHPLEQGLRPSPTVRILPFTEVRVPHPLEQGLRPIRLCFIEEAVDNVRVPHPLEQGLRPVLLHLYYYFDLCQSAPSIRTRIKTLS